MCRRMCHLFAFITLFETKVEMFSRVEIGRNYVALGLRLFLVQKGLTLIYNDCVCKILDSRCTDCKHFECAPLFHIALNLPHPNPPPPEQKINNFTGVARNNHWLTPAPILLHTLILLNCFALILEEAFITKYLSGEGVGEGGGAL